MKTKNLDSTHIIKGRFPKSYVTLLTLFKYRGHTVCFGVSSLVSIEVVNIQYNYRTWEFYYTTFTVKGIHQLKGFWVLESNYYHFCPFRDISS